MSSIIFSLNVEVHWVEFQLLNPICGVSARLLSKALTEEGVATKPMAHVPMVSTAVAAAAITERMDIEPLLHGKCRGRGPEEKRILETGRGSRGGGHSQVSAI